MPGRRVVLFVALFTVGLGGSPALAAVPLGSVGAQVEPILCDTRDISLNHRFSPIGHVELDTGAYVFDLVDIGAAGSGSRLFTRSYHSLDWRSTLLGRGWTSNFDVRIRRDSATSNDLNFTAPDGWVQRFPDALNSKEVVRSRSNSATVAMTDDGGYIVTSKGYRWTINSVGTLVRTDYPEGEWVQVEYHGVLSKSVGPDGDELAFEVVTTAEGDRLMRVTDTTELQGSVDFEFDDEWRLIQATSSNGEIRRYTYHGRSERIATISDDNNAVLIAAEYDNLGRVVRLQDADGLLDGQAEVFRYENLPDGGLRTTVTYPESRVEPGWHPVQVVTHDAFHRVTEERLRPTSTETYVGRFYYDNDDNQLSVDGPCQTLNPTPPMDGPIAGPLAVYSMLAARVLAFIAYLMQLVFDEAMRTITI